MDADHQRLIEIISSLDLICEGRGSREEVKTILASLLNYTRAHIAHEERLMDQSGYKGAGPHKFEHTVFVNRIEGFAAAFDGGKDITQDMTAFLHRWLVDHISKTDKLLVWSLANLDTTEATR
jgi:hemerythrin